MAAAPASRSDPPPAELWQQLGWQPDPGQLGQLLGLQEQLRLWNGRLNLTRLVEGDDFWVAQVFDSLWPLQPLLNAPAEPGAEPLQLIDVGTGGGFPGLAVAIALPSARLTLVDSVGRKLEAVGAMAAALGLSERLTLRCERAELSGRQPDCRGRFDWAMARAVARAPVVAEYLVPLLRPEGGRALLYRGQWNDDDQAELERALLPLRAALEDLRRCELPCARGQRHAVLLRPLAPCPKAYPRPVGQPSRQPLGGAGGGGGAGA
ncbi:MAG: 16S rRNA (guanine(527)-N(7))-methyltransferase RsmG [Synechococcaceae cyanobacterium]|nr:16S rRNA (guanine(527)-N(7))-methyltransferase RsmG [Synechococcaceae cyanobacterium]